MKNHHGLLNQSNSLDEEEFNSEEQEANLFNSNKNNLKNSKEAGEEQLMLRDLPLGPPWMSRDSDAKSSQGGGLTSDLYQLLSYTTALGVSVGLLLYATDVNHNPIHNNLSPKTTTAIHSNINANMNQVVSPSITGSKRLHTSMDQQQKKTQHNKKKIPPQATLDSFIDQYFQQQQRQKTPSIAPQLDPSSSSSFEPGRPICYTDLHPVGTAVVLKRMAINLSVAPQFILNQINFIAETILQSVPPSSHFDHNLPSPTEEHKPIDEETYFKK